MTEAGTPCFSASALMPARQSRKPASWACAGAAPSKAGLQRSAVVAARIRALSMRVMPGSLSRAGDGQPFNSDGRGVGRTLEFEVIRGRHVEEHVLQVA